MTNELRAYSPDNQLKPSASDQPTAPAVSLPKGGGAIRGIGEKFTSNPVTGTASLSIPIAVSPGRSGFTPQLSLIYDSGAGNGPFGFGWTLSLAAITRKTDKGLPQYRDDDDSDVFSLSGADDLVPVYRQDPDGTWVAAHGGYTRDVDGSWVRDPTGHLVVHEDEIDNFRIRRYRPRIEGLFARIERWTKLDGSGDVHWRSISRDNILTLYGKDAESCIADPASKGRIFSWLICETRDDRGNSLLYRYKPEDGTGVDLGNAHERNRGPQNDVRRTANRYIKRIFYGNRTPLLDNTGHRPRFLDNALIDTQIANGQWPFELVFDYGEHDVNTPLANEAGAWAFRPDPFSSYRSGFEVRNTRLCRRALMFHHFSDEPGVGHDCLVRSTDFTYSDDLDPNDVRNPVYAFLVAVNQSGYRRNNGGYDKRSLPPVSLEYSEPTVQEAVEEVDPKSLENLPIGLDGRLYRWADLHGEGTPGIVTEQNGGWFYKRNVSPLPETQPDGGERVKARFAPVEIVALSPNVALSGGAEFADLAGDGHLDVVVMDAATQGLFEHDGAEGWKPFHPFSARLNCDTRDPNVRFVDLDGDGHVDILITSDDALVWHRFRAEKGFEPQRRVALASDEEKGPRVVFADDTEQIYLADMSGDGLSDLVRIRNGEICYWPSLGFGRFGAKVTMDNAPLFDNSDQFDQQHVRLADIDGSGTADVIYLHREGVRLYFNQSGNSWSKPHRLRGFPRIDNFKTIAPVDLLGNGTVCLVWSSPSEPRRQMRYVNLMGDRKPHLLVKTVNNLGAETTIRYAPSTKFYLQDKRSGRPWITRLPFPVHVVESVEVIDRIAQSRHVTRRAYHHGCFDGEEREFRGFGLVEEWDTEAFEDYVVGVKRVQGSQELAPELNQPPVTTRTWFHTGAFGDQDHVLHQYRHEYYGQAQHTPEPVLPAGLSSDELRECVRALKGVPLRQEIYSFDGTADEQYPYTVTESNFEVRRVQPRGRQRHGVFFPVGRETLSLTYERNPADPRISHAFGLDRDEYGNARKSCDVVYGRKIVDPALPAEVVRDQYRRYVAYSETDYTPDIDRGVATDDYRLRVPFESRGYEITGVAPAADLFNLKEIEAAIAGAAPIGFEIVADDVQQQKRLLSQSRALFLDNSLNPLPLGQWDSLGLVFRSYQLAFTPGVTALHYAGKVNDADFAAAGYVHFGSDANWWIPSGTSIYPADYRGHFYVPVGSRDPFGVETVGTFDRYNLLLEKVEVRQAAWNVVSAINDYRILNPVQVTDANGNRSGVEHDALGMVVKIAVMGKVGSTDGDTLADPTARLEYELFNWMNNSKPNYVHRFAREQHGAANPRWQEAYAFSDGSGNVSLLKVQAHPGKAFAVAPDGTKVEVDADPRWIGSGRTITNNKGKPVKQYEPYFSTTHEYEDEKTLREIGVTPVLFYDPVGRNIRTLWPDGSLSRIELTPWMQKTFDRNDTVKQSTWYAERGSPDPATEPEPLNDPERRAAWLAAKHADTPSTVHADSLGRAVYSVSDYGGGKTASVRSEMDLTGRLSKVFDQQQRQVASTFTGMARLPILAESAEKGRQWTFQNILLAPVKIWDEQGRAFRVDYDVLHRAVSVFVRQAGGPEILLNYIVYGDRLANADQLNLLGAPHQVFDQAGMLRVPEIDFKGNPKSVERILAKDYRNDPDWSDLPGQSDVVAIQAAANPRLEIAEVFTASSLYDALNRPTRATLPDGTVIVPTYNEANFLASLQAQIRGQGGFIDFLKGQDYDAKGQRQFARYGNGVFTQYFYDPSTYRLANLLTYRSGDDAQAQSLQNLKYTYDPVGNITLIGDDAQQTHYFNNAVVKPEGRFEYDAIYQLIRATGRELAGPINDTIRIDGDLDVVGQLPHANDAAAVRTYTEEYEYDLLGNIKVVRHRFQQQPGIGIGWTRHYRYAFDGDQANLTNRLAATSMPGDPDDGPYTGTYDHDAYGNMIRMPHLAEMRWNSMDQLRHVDLGGGGAATYVYSLSGQRQRKIIERNGNAKLEWIYLGPVMIFRRRRRNTDELRFERWTLYIRDNAGRIAQVDSKTRDDDNSDPANALGAALIRYQYTDHLGSAVLETNENGDPISYEEYHPYGTSAYRSAKPGFDISLKRFRFGRKERDDETGLCYFGARYYAPWLGRWVSGDPKGLVDGLDLFCYCRNNPIMLTDPSGTDSDYFANFPLKDAPKDVKQALTTNTEAARQKLDTYMTGRTIQVGDKVFEHIPGSTYWDAKHHKNAGLVREVQPTSEQDVTEGDDYEIVVVGKRGEGSDKGGEGDKKPSADTPPPSPSDDPASIGGPESLAGTGSEKFIWDYPFAGVRGAQRGRIMEWMFGNSWRDNTPRYDIETPTSVQQIKSTDNFDKVGQIARDATRDADAAITANPTGTMAGKQPQAVVVTPTDAPPTVDTDLGNALGRARKPFSNNPLPPEHVRGLPGGWGTAARGFAIGGTGLSAYGFVQDLRHGDYPMAGADALSTAGGGLEVYALFSSGGTVAGVSAMGAGLVLGGAGIAIGSAISAYRAYQRGDAAGVVAGVAGVAAGLAITAGVIFGAPLLLIGGIIGAIGVGLFHFFRWLFGD